MTQPTGPFKTLASNDGSVLVMAGTAYSEREIADDREQIVQRLHGAYLNLLDHMDEFQDQWDSDPAIAFVDALYEGGKVGGGDWGKSLADLFDKETWSQVGTKVQGFAGKAYDTMHTYSAEQYEILQQSFEAAQDVVDNADDTIKNWAWWQTVMERSVHEARDYGQRRIDAASQHIGDLATAVSGSADKANKLFKHREAILNLPDLLSAGDAKGVQAFVDTVLMDIDPELAKSIKQSGKFHIVLELIADHDSILNYVSYLGLMIEAVPPNFYAYTGAKFGMQLLLEAILTVVCALFTFGAGVAARLTTLAARLMTLSAKAASGARHIQKAQAAIHAYVRMLEDFMDAAAQLQRLGEKLVGNRARGTVLRGQTRQTLSAKKQLIKRDTHCRLCGSADHSTPRGRLGNVVYD